MYQPPTRGTQRPQQIFISIVHVFLDLFYNCPGDHFCKFLDWKLLSAPCNVHYFLACLVGWGQCFDYSLDLPPFFFLTILPMASPFLPVHPLPSSLDVVMLMYSVIGRLSLNTTVWDSAARGILSVNHHLPLVVILVTRQLDSEEFSPVCFPLWLLWTWSLKVDQDQPSSVFPFFVCSMDALKCILYFRLFPPSFSVMDV